jgi:serine/threonine-protein kinase
MTPAWASPEQVRGEAVTTSTDVYSLGVMLYELLCGASPYRPRTQSVEALLDAIREQEPELCSKAAQRVSSHASFAAELEGDLDAVVARALRKNPADRYGSVTALAADLRAYLEGSVTEARRGDARYRLVRFVRRHRLAVGALTVVVLSPAGALGTGSRSAPLRAAALPRAHGALRLPRRHRRPPRGDRDARASRQRRAALPRLSLE